MVCSEASCTYRNSRSRYTHLARRKSRCRITGLQRFVPGSLLIFTSRVQVESPKTHCIFSHGFIVSETFLELWIPVAGTGCRWQSFDAEIANNYKWWTIGGLWFCNKENSQCFFVKLSEMRNTHCLESSVQYVSLDPNDTGSGRKNLRNGITHWQPLRYIQDLDGPSVNW